jgi:hypothetical protein
VECRHVGGAGRNSWLALQQANGSVYGLPQAVPTEAMFGSLLSCLWRLEHAKFRVGRPENERLGAPVLEGALVLPNQRVFARVRIPAHDSAFHLPNRIKARLPPPTLRVPSTPNSHHQTRLASTSLHHTSPTHLEVAPLHHIRSHADLRQDS